MKNSQKKSSPDTQPGRPSQHRQPSRKGKKAWRKHVDITDVERTQEQIRAEEIAGGRIEVRTDADLFMVDTAGDVATKKDYGRKLKTYEILEARSKFPTPPAMKAPVKKAGPSREGKRIHKMASKLNKVSPALSRKRKADSADTASPDLWDETPAPPPSFPNTTRDDFIIDLVIKPTIKTPDTIGQTAQNAPAPVLPAHPGNSYIPEVAARAELIAEVASRDAKKKEDAADLKRRLGFNKNLHFVDGRDLITGAKADAAEREDEEENATEDATEDTPAKKVKPSLRKSVRVRTREAAQKEREEAEQTRRRERLLATQANRAHDVVSLIKKETSAKGKLAESRRQARAEAALLPKKKLGKYRVPDAPVLVTPDVDLTDSLRRLRPEGNVLSDRFHSLMSRNIVEARVPVQKKRKFARQTYEIASYKNFS